MWVRLRPRISSQLVLPLKANIAGLERFATAVTRSVPAVRRLSADRDARAAVRRLGGRSLARRPLPAPRRRQRGQDRRDRSVRRRDDVGRRRAQRCSGPDAGAPDRIRAGAPRRAPVERDAHPGRARRRGHRRRRPRHDRPVPARRRSDRRRRMPASRETLARPRRAHFVSGYGQRTGTAAGCPQRDSATTASRPNEYLTAYDYAPLQPSGVTGQGERVALIEIDGFKLLGPADVRRAASASRCRPIKSTASGSRTRSRPGGETTLDLELLDAAAPGTEGGRRLRVARARVEVLEALTAPLQQPRPRTRGDLGVARDLRAGARTLAIGRSGARARRRRARAGRRERDLGARVERRRGVDARASDSRRPARPARGQLPGLVAVRDRRRRDQRPARLPPTRSRRRRSGTTPRSTCRRAAAG